MYQSSPYCQKYSDNLINLKNLKVSNQLCKNGYFMIKDEGGFEAIVL